MDKETKFENTPAITEEDLFDESIPDEDEDESASMYWLSFREHIEYDFLQSHPEIYKICIGRAEWGLTDDGHFRDGGISFLENVEDKFKNSWLSNARKTLEVKLVAAFVELDVITLDESYLNDIYKKWSSIIESQKMAFDLNELSREREAENMQFLYGINVKNIRDRQEENNLIELTKSYSDAINKIKKDFNR